MSRASMEERGAIFTRREVVDFILDLVGYTVDLDLSRLRMLEPSFGEGDFLIAIVDRLIESWQQKHTDSDPAEDLGDSLRAIELHEDTCDKTRAIILDRLISANIDEAKANELLNRWLRCGDFLLADLNGPFDFVVGNPPYVRQELIPDELMEAYRALYFTIYDRADIYVPFIERSLSLLSDKGALGFICADRWMKNRYGKRLRELVANEYRLKIYVDMVDTPAFHSEVIAYPAITVITKERSGKTRVARRPNIDRVELKVLSQKLLASKVPSKRDDIRELTGVAAGSEPWILDSFEKLELLRRLESNFPCIEAVGCKVGIGVATGADQSFIGRFNELDVESDRKLPLATTRDIVAGVVQWRGLGIVNPFSDQGGLVALDDYPKLKKYLEDRKDRISERHVAKKAPANWYRTIDRIYPSLALKPKLLIPDIMGEAQIVYEDGRLYPHHNLYFLTSDGWDLHALQAVLLSGIARLFISMYSTKMRGGFLRFQAQYLRRIRLPEWGGVNRRLRHTLSAAAEDRDVEACNNAVFDLYRMSAGERRVLRSISRIRKCLIRRSVQ